MSAEPAFDRTPTSCNVAWQICALLRSATREAPCGEAAFAADSSAKVEAFFPIRSVWARVNLAC